MRYRKQLEFLKQSGSNELHHSGRTLYKHLVGTGKMLLSYNRPEEEVLIGLFHSIYGTASYKKSKSLNMQREEIKNLIGEYAEQAVYIFCNINPRVDKIVMEDWIPNPFRDSLRWVEYCNLSEQNSDNRYLPTLRKQVLNG